MLFEDFQKDGAILEADRSQLPHYRGHLHDHCLLEDGKCVLQSKAHPQKPAQAMLPAKSGLLAVAFVTFNFSGAGASIWNRNGTLFSQRADAVDHTGNCISVCDGYCVELSINQSKLEPIVFLVQSPLRLSTRMWPVWWRLPSTLCIFRFRRLFPRLVLLGREHYAQVGLCERLIWFAAAKLSSVSGSHPILPRRLLVFLEIRVCAVRIRRQHSFPPPNCFWGRYSQIADQPSVDGFVGDSYVSVCSAPNWRNQEGVMRLSTRIVYVSGG